MNADAVLAAEVDSTRLDIREVTRRLNNHLGRSLVAFLAGSQEGKASTDWATPDGPVPPDEAQKRLRTAHRIWVALADAESAATARTWFIGSNPVLSDQAPAYALREGRLHDVSLAARAFLTGTWSA